MGEWRGKTESTGEATKRGILQKEFSHIVRISARFPTISTGEGGLGVHLSDQISIENQR